MNTTRLVPDDPLYPELLGAVPSPPALDVRGALTPADGLAIAIVGSRRATAYGRTVAETLAADLAARGVTIVSGFARGIDTAAHRAALEAGGRTIAVLGCGIDVVYPSENRSLAHEIAEQGALVSQFPRTAPPLAGFFPVRNRTIAGLALGVVVVEAAGRSGALITAGYAADLGREVFAVPGRLTDATSEGPHRLIQDGAKLVRDWKDIVQELNDRWRRALHPRVIAAIDAEVPSAESEGGRILALLAVDEPQHIETLIARASGDAARVGAALLGLELSGRARQLEGQRWIAVGARVRRA